MKLFSKKRLQIVENNGTTIIRWWKTAVFTMFLLFFLLVWGIAGLLGYKEVMGMKLIEMSHLAWIIYWSITVFFLFHLFFNRIVKLEISNEHISYRRGIIPGLKFKGRMSDIVRVRIDHKIAKLVESLPDGRDVGDYRVIILWTVDKTSKIKGFGEKDAILIKSIIEQHLDR